MNSFVISGLTEIPKTAAKLDQWVEALKMNKSLNFPMYDPPTAQDLERLENVRQISKELQSRIPELETSVRIAHVANSEMAPTAPVLDHSEKHEFITANQLDNVYSEEDKVDAKEEEKRKITKGKGAKSEMQSFFSEQCVLLTGGTGFLGKVLIEKLLRACSDIDTIYLLVRNKKGKDAASRVRDMLDDTLFAAALEANPKCKLKVVAVCGDLIEPGLGLSPIDRALLTNRVTIIINSAATVRFDERLSLATAINVRGAREVVSLARECRGLCALTHVSTAFAHCPNPSIEERFYDPPMSAEALECLSTIDDSLLQDITPEIIGEYPNTYCFTKAISEDAIRKYGEGMPICIVRPGIVVSTYEEPIRGWTDNLYGPTGVMVGIGTGVLRTMYMDQSKKADIVPVDYTVNAILSATWDTAKRFRENQTSDIPIYNYVSSPQNPLTWGQFIDMNQRNGIDKPTVKAVWYYGINMTNSYYMFLFYNFFLHYLPALLIDAYLALTGKKRMMLSLYKKVFKFSDILCYFSTKDWKFSDSAVQALWSRLSGGDQTLFPFSMANMSWEYHSETLLLGLRVYVVKDDLSTMPEARKKWQRLYYMHQILKAVTLILVLNLGYWLLKIVNTFSESYIIITGKS